jgi:PKD repeat protein
MNKKKLWVFTGLMLLTSIARAQYLNGAFAIGSNAGDQVTTITSDDAGNIYVLGYYGAVCDFDPGPGTYNLTPLGGYYTYMAKYTSAGNLVWANQFREISGNVTANRMIADSAGNTFITGVFSGMVDFNPGSGNFVLTATGFNEGFIVKLDPAGNFLWAKKLTTTNHSQGQSIALGPDQSLYITGYFSGTTDFDPGLATYNLVSTGMEDSYVLKLNASGNFVWAKRFGGNSWDAGLDITTDLDGNIYALGYFRDTADFGSLIKISSGMHDISVTKITPTGNLLWTSTMGGDFEDKFISIEVDTSHYIYLAGVFEDVADFNPDSAVVYNLTASGNDDMGVVKLNSAGGFVWAKQFGGFNVDLVGEMVLDDSSNIYLGGVFNETADFDPGIGIHNLLSAGLSDGYITKWNSAGNFIWVKQLQGTDYNGCGSLEMDASNYLYAGGAFYSTVDFDPNGGVFNLSSLGIGDGFITKIGAPPPPSAQFTAPNSVCEGDTILFTNTTLFGPAAYQWSFAGGSPAASSLANPQVVYNTPGTYHVTLIASSIYGSDTLFMPNYVVVNPLPATPIINHAHPNLFSSYPTGNQWYYNGTLIAGATGQYFQPSANGTYTVLYTNASGCSSLSAGYVFNSLGIDPAVDKADITLYPNPTHQFLQINLNATDGAHFIITDLSGKICLTGQLKEVMDVSALSNGIYMLEIRWNDFQYREKWIKY